jgi:hypothetical protein
MNLHDHNEIVLAWGRGQISDADYEAWLAKHQSNEERARRALTPKLRRRDTAPPPADSPCYARIAAPLNLDARLTGRARQLVAFVIQMKRGRAHVDLFIEQIADSLGCSVRTVQRAQRDAERRGYLRVEHRRAGRINDPNRYRTTPSSEPAPPPGSLRRNVRPTPLTGQAINGVTKKSPHEESDQEPLPLTPSPQAGRGDRSRPSRPRGARRPRARGLADGSPQPGAELARTVPDPAPGDTQTDLIAYLDVHPPPHAPPA